MLGVGDVLFQDLQLINLRSELGRQRSARNIAGFRHFTRGARRIGGDYRLDAQLADDVAALAERVDVAFDRFDGAQRRTFRRHELVLYRQKPFADDMQA